MSNFSKIALMAVSIGIASVGQIGAASANSGGMGDPSAAMRANLAICDAQRRGEYPRYFEACLPDYHGPYDRGESPRR
jgi:hypothetical protein